MKLLFVLSLLLYNLNYSEKEQAGSATIQGVVVGKDSNRPVSKAYLFVVKGEEETLTANNGKFSITTWQHFPVALTVEHPGFKKVNVIIREPGNNQLIKLEQQ